MLEDSWTIEDRYGLSFWDALVVAAARSATCEYLLTEDLQDGQELEGLTVLSPFTRTPASIA